ncbi:uncharacterized protein LOC117646559 [Thrips palmi]|uniref:Uncharacterized protein LOC117646559 n=1 Tax=Thrips palmi TaxID=161013 RepID=A0A6P8Z0L5_THRPL|nr:uncharacterized protein LOC117646559 [Thrips palmi]
MSEDKLLPKKKAKLLLKNISSGDPSPALHHSPSSCAPPASVLSVPIIATVCPTENFGPSYSTDNATPQVTPFQGYLPIVTGSNDPHPIEAVSLQTTSGSQEIPSTAETEKTFYSHVNIDNIQLQSMTEVPSFQSTIISSDNLIISGFQQVELHWSDFLNVPALLDPDTGSTGDIPAGISSPAFPHQEWPTEDTTPESVNVLGNEQMDTLVSILAFAQSVKMSGADLCKLLDLLHVIFPESSKTLPYTKHMFFSSLKIDQNPVEISYYCNVCWKQRENSKDVCSCKNSKVKYFITCSIQSQLEKIFKREGIKDELNHRFSRTKVHPENIEDIYDSNVYKTAEVNFLNGTLNISLTWYTDGISIYECSTYSLWPFVFVINELPLHSRFKPENLILAGLWGDCEKPHPNIFLLPMYRELSKLYTDGFKVDNEVVKVCVLAGTCDIPAKSTFMNMKGHAGYESCPKCFIVGEKSERTGMVTVFPHADELILRNADNYKECVQTSVQTKKDSKGVYGPTILSYMTCSDFIESVAVDSMHCVFMGVCKQLLNLWFNPKFASKPFSLVERTAEVNIALQSLKLPHFVQRLPEDVTKLGYWKASLCRNFLLYFALPIMNGIMKADYYNNLSLLVEGLSLLDKQSIFPANTVTADNDLKSFCSGFENLYGVRNMSMNIHLLRHLAKSVEDTGNLFVTSCYRLEDFNGKVSALAHGTQHAPQQIVTNFSYLTELPGLISKMQNSEAKQFCKNILKKSINFVLKEKICANTYVVGEMDSNLEYRDCLSTFSVPNGEMYHGQILTFVKTTLHNVCQYFALVSCSVDEPSDVKGYVLFQAGDMLLIPVQQLCGVTFCIHSNSKKYLIDPLNNFELE